MNKFGMERTPSAQNSKMVEKLDTLKFWDPRHEIKSLRDKQDCALI
jgi:hypothetical protein